MSKVLSAGQPHETASTLVVDAVERLAGEVSQYPLFQTCEVVRLACLPWNVGGQVQPDTEDGVPLAELLVLIAAASSPDSNSNPLTDDLNLFREAKRWKAAAKEILHLAQLKHLAELRAAGPVQSLDKIAMSMRANEVWIRSSSYPDMLNATLTALFGPHEISAAVHRILGFTATEAVAVLEACHELQVEGWNNRMNTNAAALEDLIESDDGPDNIPQDDPRLRRFRESWLEAWQGAATSVGVRPTALAERTGLDFEVVESVIQNFRLDLDGRTPEQVVQTFANGDNPLRTNPLMVSESGDVMLVHHMFNHSAVRESLEQALKSDAAWETYQYHRGQLLERLAAEALNKLLPGADIQTSFEYFVPADSAQASKAPSEYTKKVEGDILLVLDDVALIVEAKAVAISPRSRTGETRRLRRDLIGIVKSASTQASRLAERIETDSGIRLHRGGWLDLSKIREVHLVAVSLEDLVSVSTATADLAAADLLDSSRIPWTVSIHDLQIIADLVENPAEFLLYLRRRCDDEASMVYFAPDELDLFLYFYESGLYVPPDPEKVEKELPFVKPRPGARRRRNKVKRTLISSRTDPLDQWHNSKFDPSAPVAPKPALTGSPIVPLVKELQARRDYGWLSIGATLLSGSTKAQADLARQAHDLLANPDPGGRERSATIPIGSTRANAWLLIWITRPPDVPPQDAIALATSYLRAKKHQLGLTRGAAFIWDESGKALSTVLYDGEPPKADPELDKQAENLFPADFLPRRIPPAAKRRKKR